MTNEELVHLAKKGDQEASRRLYENCKVFVKAVAMRILWRIPDEAEDAVQETMLRVFKHLETFDGRSSFKTWIHTIASNYALGILRKNKTSALALSAPIEADEDGEILTIQIPEEERGYQIFEAKSDLSKIWEGMTDAGKEALSVGYLEDVSGHDGANMLRVTLSAYKSRVYRGMGEARRIMADMEVPLSKRKCWKCEKDGRFRFADVLVDRQPVCKWCATELQPKQTANVAEIKKPQYDKVCKCGCGRYFTADHRATAYIDGHKPKAPSAYVPKRDRPASESQISAVEPASHEVMVDMVTLNIPVTALDRMYATLGSNDKARFFELLMREM